MENYVQGDLIGEGSFGKVYRGLLRATKKEVAMKLISKSTRPPGELVNFRHECNIQRNLHHPNIIQMIDSFETPENIYVVTELAKEDLATLLKREKACSVRKMQFIAYHVVSALHYLHNARILHRDIKPQNVLIGMDGYAKLCDFGFARTMSIDTYMLTSCKGTPLYMAPEIIYNRPYDQNADLWSLGCILYELVVGEPPFKGEALGTLVHAIQFEDVVWTPKMTSDCKSFLKGLLEKNSSRRLTWPHLLKHPFLRDSLLDDKPSDQFALTKALSPSQELMKEKQRQHLQKELDRLSRKVAKAQKHFETTQKNLQRYSHEGNYMPLPKHPPGNTVLAKEEHPQNAPLKKKSPMLSPESKHAGCGDASSDTESVSSCETLSSSSSSKSYTSDDERTVIMEGNSRENKTALNGHYKKFNNSTSLTPLETAMENLQLDKEGKFRGSCVFWKSGILTTLNSSGTDAQPIQNEEWIYFLGKIMKEVKELPQNMCQKPYLSLYVAPLRNHHTEAVVIEKIATLLAMPFPMLQDDEALLKELQNLYHESKVLPNLLRSCQLIVKRKIDKSSLSSRRYGKGLEIASILDDEDLDGLDKCMRLITYLTHIEKKFAFQLCESVFVLEAFPLLLLFLTLHTRKTRITVATLSVLSHILRMCPADAQMVEVLILGLHSVNNEEILRLMSHSDPGIQSKSIRLIAYIISQSTEVRDRCISPNAASVFGILDLASASPHSSVKQAAEFLSKKIDHVFPNSAQPTTQSSSSAGHRSCEETTVSQ